MLTVTKETNLFSAYQFNGNYRLEDILYFDIETTGFAAEVTTLYLIGCVYYKNGCWNTIQWFANNNTSEHDMLLAFFELMKNYKVLIHYNGDGFDIPYILKKCAKYQLDYNFNQITSLDIYKKILPYKKFLKLENLKQKTVEKFLSISRDDQYSGGELIKIYGNYLKNRIQHLPEADHLFQLLLLHNEDDLKGMLQVVQVLNYSDLFTQDIVVTDAVIKNEELILSLQLSCCLPKRISYGNDTFYFSAFEKNAALKVQLYKNELKFFYSNYKDYYYLPSEDTAIHKSVAFYVDKDFRTKAKAANCYSKKTGCFIPQYDEIITPYFRIDFYDKTTYAEATDELLKDKDLLSYYVKHVLKRL